jgi:hypothetical protein
VHRSVWRSRLFAARHQQTGNEGLAVDRVEHHITHVLLDEGDTRGRTRAAIPIGSIIDIDDVTHGVRVDLTRVQVSNLSAVELGTQG